MLHLNVPWSALDTFILIGYFVLMIGVGLRFRSKARKSMSSYFLSGRSLALPLVIGTMMTSWYDGYSLVGVAEYGATIGIAGMIVYIIPCTLSRVPFALWIAPLVRGKIPEDVLTVPDLMEYLYDRKAKLLSTIAVLAGVLYNGVNFLVISQLLELMFDFPSIVAIIISGVITGIYVMASGMWSVTMTDVFQLLIISVSVGIGVIMIMNAAGGWEGIFNTLNPQQPTLFEPSGGMNKMTALSWALIGLSIYTEPMMYQRFSASDSAKTAKRSFLFCVPMWLVYSSAVIMIGFCARTLHPDAVFYEAFWNTVLEVLPMGLRGIFVAGLIAIVMSTQSSYVLVQAAACTKDVYTGFTGKTVPDDKLIKWNNIATVVVLIFSVLSTQAWMESIINGLYFVTGFQIAGLFIPLVMGLFYKKKTAAAGWVTTAFGYVFWLIWEYIFAESTGIPANSITWVVTFFVFIIVAKLTYKKPEA